MSGYTFVWSAKKQPRIALSSTKAKYMAMTHAGKEAMFLNHLYSDIGIPHSIPIYLCDKQEPQAVARPELCSDGTEVRVSWY